MPLIDEELRVTDQRQRRASPWPWVVVIGAIAVVLALLSVGISVLARARPANNPADVARQINTGRLDSAEQIARYGDWYGAAALIQAIDPSVAMDTSQKHTYLRLGAQSLSKSGNPAAAVPYYERYIGWAADLDQAECKSCHAPPTAISPRSPVEMTSSRTGAAYTAALTAAGQLSARRTALQKQLKQNPEDVRLRLLLYPLEKALRNEKAAREQLAALKSASKQAQTSNPQ